METKYFAIILLLAHMLLNTPLHSAEPSAPPITDAPDVFATEIARQNQAAYAQHQTTAPALNLEQLLPHWVDYVGRLNAGNWASFNDYQNWYYRYGFPQAPNNTVTNPIYRETARSASGSWSTHSWLTDPLVTVDQWATYWHNENARQRAHSIKSADEAIARAMQAEEDAKAAQEQADADLARSLAGTPKNPYHRHQKQSRQPYNPYQHGYVYQQPYYGHNYIQLPPSLMSLPGVNVFHPRVVEQTGAQCGPWALSNAVAIQRIIAQHGNLTPEAIQQQAPGILHSCPRIARGQNIEEQTIREAAETLNLDYGFIVGIDTAHNIYTFSRTTLLNPTIQLEDIRRTWQRNQKIALHFIFNPGTHRGGHYVTISIIKDGQHAPSIIYMDSCNQPLSDAHPATHLIRFIYSNIIYG